MIQCSPLVLSFSLIVADFLSLFPIEFPIQVLSFSSCSLGEHRFYHRLTSLLHRLVHLIPWCCSLRYYCYLTHCKFFFYPSFNWLFLLTSEWRQVSSCLQDSSQYSSRSFCLYTVKCKKTVLFQTIQLNISTQFKCQNSPISNNSVKHKYTVSFYLTQRKYTVSFYLIGPYLVLPRRAWVDLGAMAMNRYSIFPKAPVLLEHHYQIVSCYI